MNQTLTLSVGLYFYVHVIRIIRCITLYAITLRRLVLYSGLVVFSL